VYNVSHTTVTITLCNCPLIFYLDWCSGSFWFSELCLPSTWWYRWYL